MSLLPEVRQELLATAARRASDNPAAAQWRRWLRADGLTVAVSVTCTVLVAAAALLAFGHRTGPGSHPGGRSTVVALEAKLAVLRRPQTAADRTYPGFQHAFPPRGLGPDTQRLTRLAATISTPTAGTVRVFVLVGPLSLGPRTGSSSSQSEVVNAFAIDAHGKLRGHAGPLTARTLETPNAIGSGLFGLASKANRDIGVTVGIVPDWVARVTWTFTGAGYGITHPHPVTIYPQVSSNVAVAPVAHGQGPLKRATWYRADGSVIASSSGGSQAFREFGRIRSVNASRDRPIAPFLLAHYALFRSVSPDTPAVDPALPTPGFDGGYVGEMRLNYWQTRFTAAVTGLDGDGLWITPGTHGLCISDPQTSGCNTLQHADSTGIIIAGITSSSNGPRRQTIAGLVPDGNRSVTLQLADGTRRTVPVIDHNIFEATVPGQITAIIARNTTGHVQRKTVG